MKAGVVRRLGQVIPLTLLVLGLSVAPAFADHDDATMECNVAIPNSASAYLSCDVTNFADTELSEIYFSQWASCGFDPHTHNSFSGYSLPAEASLISGNFQATLSADDGNFDSEHLGCNMVEVGVDPSWEHELHLHDATIVSGSPFPPFPDGDGGGEETAAHIAGITAAAEQMKDDTIAVGTATLPYAAGVLVLVIGWLFVKRHIIG